MSGDAQLFCTKSDGPRKVQFSTFLTFLKTFRLFSKTTLPNLEFWVSTDRKSCGNFFRKLHFQTGADRGFSRGAGGADGFSGHFQKFCRPFF